MNAADKAAVIRIKSQGWPGMSESDALAILTLHRLRPSILTLTPAELIRKAFP